MRLTRTLLVLAAALAPVFAPAVRAGGLDAVGSCSEAVVAERHYGSPQRRSDGIAVEEVYLTLDNGQHLDGPAMLGTSGFFWDYTPGHRVAVCVQARKPLQLLVTDRETGASFRAHP